MKIIINRRFVKYTLPYRIPGIEKLLRIANKSSHPKNCYQLQLGLSIARLLRIGKTPYAIYCTTVAFLKAINKIELWIKKFDYGSLVKIERRLSELQFTLKIKASKISYRMCCVVYGHNLITTRYTRTM